MDELTRWQEVSSAFWPDELEGPWLVRLGWREVGGRKECVGMVLAQKEPAYGDPYPPAPILTATKVRAVPVGDFIDRGRRMLAGSAETVAGLDEAEGQPEDAKRVREYGRRFEGKAGGRPRLYGEEHYRHVARVYSDAWRGGEPPTQAVERHPDFEPISHSTAARWVRECRKRGFLGETEKRVAGGVLPPEQEEES
jgi:hypothetical protein